MAQKHQLDVSHLAELASLESKGYRDAFLETDVKGGIAYQIQALREKLSLSQKAFAEKIGKKQSVVSRLEDTEYGSVNVNTLLEIAKALDIGLQVRFCDYIDVLERDISPTGMKVNSIFETIEKIKNTNVKNFNTVQATSSQVIVHTDLGAQKWPSTNLQSRTPLYPESVITSSGTFIPTNYLSAYRHSTSH